MKTNNNEENKLKKLFDFLDSRLLIDKFIDLILIFVGLLCALSVENYIENNEKRRKINNCHNKRILTI